MRQYDGSIKPLFVHQIILKNKKNFKNRGVTKVISYWATDAQFALCRPIFYLDKSKRKNEIPGKNLSKVVKFRNFLAKSCKIRKI